mmetsp:Transcript_117887/g.184208  ORF Transcript_117887/g.184208 Transcript_117887/m.184208 type:complete len:217 (+) Transcript_117887:44-694(+)
MSLAFAHGAARCFVSLVLLVSVPSECSVRAVGDCMQDSPLRYGCEAYRSQYADICCTVPQRWAENRGFLQVVSFFQQLEQTGASAEEITFYDSQCGVPLYVAPKGRSYDDFKAESLKHGWPSFRAAEVVRANVYVSSHGGEVVSACNTHLGHDLPDSKGERHCINLMCMAGNLANWTGQRFTGSATTHGASSTGASSAATSTSFSFLSFLLWALRF